MLEQSIICKTCGALLDDLAAKSANGLVTCKYCQNVWTVPHKSTSPAALEFLRIGEHNLDTGKFDDAIEAYKKAAAHDGREPEAYFGIALSEFKVRYLKDHVNNRVQPICYEATKKKFTKSEAYMRALENATAEQRAEYKRKGEEIDHILAEFSKLKQAGVSYDCFICVKVTEGNSKEHTEDSRDAEYIYRLLQENGYKPFYSEMELRNVTGADYEARILYALYTSECMLVVCRDESYLQTPWVKNEYSRFLKLVNDEEKESESITIVFNETPIEKLPGRKGKIQGIDFAKRSADRQIIEFVRSHTPEARARRAAEAKAKSEAEEAQRRAIEEQRKAIEEQQHALEEQRKAMEEEQRRAIEEQRKAIEEQQKQLAEQLEKLKSTPAGGTSAEVLTDDELLEKMERARAERERKKREEEERKRQEEERRRQEEERRRQEEERIAREFDIAGTELKHYKGNGGQVEIPQRVTVICDNAFKDFKNLTSITIPDGVEFIGNGAFFCCKSLKSITIPNSVESIGDNAFEGCTGLTAVYITDIKAWCNIKFGNYKANPLCYAHNLYLNNKLVTKLDIPNGVTTIGNFAFSGCKSLTSITIPNSIKSIGNNAFKGCACLENITIPNSVKSIGSNAFEGCTGLTAVYITDIKAWCNIKFGGYSANPLYHAHKLYLNNQLVTKLNIPDGVTAIEDFAFNDCAGLTSIIVPRSVTAIGRGAFSCCTGLTSIIIPNSVESIGDNAFEACAGLTAVYITDIKAWCNIKFGNLSSNPLSFAHNLYLNGQLVTDLEISQGVTDIKANVFQGCTCLTSVTLSYGVSSINNSAFSGCAGLKNITIPNSVTTIGCGVFEGCSKLGSITIPFVGNGSDKTHFGYIFGTGSDSTNSKFIPPSLKRVVISGGTSIGENAFCGCESLTSITISNSVTAIGEGAFSGCIGLTSITIPNSLKSIGKSVFEGCRGLTSITIPNSVTFIGDEAFKGCTGLTSITISNSVTSIGYCAFQGCAGLKSITIPNSVTTIGNYAFVWCTSLTSITIPNSVIAICKGAFLNCTGLTSITIPNSVKSIGSEAFKECTGLTSITIPDSVTSIGSEAFSCTGLTSITISNNVTTIGCGVLEGCLNLESITIPFVGDGSDKTHFGYIFGANSYSDNSKFIPSSLKTVVMTGGKSIAKNAFSGCTSLTSVTIPNGVTTIAAYAFQNCTSLTSITIPNSVTDNRGAFYGCNENLTIYCSAKKKGKSWSKNWDVIKPGNIFTTKRAKVVWGYKGK